MHNSKSFRYFKAPAADRLPAFVYTPIAYLLLISFIAGMILSCTINHQIPEKVSFLEQMEPNSGLKNSPEISEKMHFWREQKRGSNAFLHNYRPDYFKEAKAAGIQYLRYGPDLLPSDSKDFLIGDLDNFTHINQKDLATLRSILDDAYNNGIGIVLTMFELPGHRYGNPREVETDCRLWQDEQFWFQSFEFWKQLAEALKDHPAIVAYNPINEPVAAYAYGFEDPGRRFTRWLDNTRGTTADLNLFNKLMVTSIREADKLTPIMLDGYFWADPKGLPYMEAIEDPNILYAFHNPAPWIFSSLEGNKGKYSYPAAMPKYWNGPAVPWTLNDLETFLDPVVLFMEKNRIQDYQIVASEFWCNRRIHGCAEYFNDLISLYNKNNWHWGFWQFRADGSYTGLDYELGDAPDSGLYIVKSHKKGIDPDKLKSRSPNPVWNVLSAALKEEEITDAADTRTLPVPALEEEINRLITALHNEEWIVQDAAALDLAEMGSKAYGAVPHLLVLLEHEEWIVRRSSIYALSKIGALQDRMIRNAIRKLKKDPEEHVRIEANLALGLLRIDKRAQ